MTRTHVNAVGSSDKMARYRIWKEHHVPLVYDWLSSRQLAWPHGAVQWGSLSNPSLESFENINMNNNNNSNNSNNINSTTNMTRRSDRLAQAYSMRSLYLAERTNNNKNDPNTLLQYEIRVIHELVNKPSDIAKPWIEEGSASDRDPTTHKDYALRKRVLHPGEVNRIRVVSNNIVVTQTDSPHLMLWNMSEQPDRKKNETFPSKPTCILTGHTKNTEFAVDVFKPATYGTTSNILNQHIEIPNASIVSGGTDHNVCLWRLRDHESLSGSLRASVCFAGCTPGALSGVANGGHSNVVEDVSFKREDDGANTIVSVGRDSAMIIWDARTPRNMVKVPNAHPSDINCCDFGGFDGNQIATGGSDKVIRIWDMRKLKNTKNEAFPLLKLRGHQGEITALSWNRYEKNVFASGSQDGHVMVWRVDSINNNQNHGTTGPSNGNANGNANGNENGNMNTSENMNGNVFSNYERLPMHEAEGYSPELMFKHVGHNYTDSKIIDLDWLPTAVDRWCLASLSEITSGGSTLQMWRISDLIYRPKEDVMEELEQHSDRSL